MKTITPIMSAMLMFGSACFVGGCKSPQGATIPEKQQSVLEMRRETLAMLHKQNPNIEDHVNKAPGYAVFSNFGLKILVAGTGNGYGVAHDNKTGADTYMRMGEVNVGLGFGAKDFRVLFVFNKESVMHDFMTDGWDFGGNAEVGAKLHHEGAEAGKKVSVGDIDIYQITKTGAALQATVGGTKYWKDKDLNGGK